MVENIGGKGENADNQHFLLFPQCFQKSSLKLGILWYLKGLTFFFILLKKCPLRLTESGFFHMPKNIFELLLVLSLTFFRRGR